MSARTTPRHSTSLSLRARLVSALVLLVLLVTASAAAWSSHRASVEATEAQDSLLTRVSQIVGTPGSSFAQGDVTRTNSESGLVVELLQPGAASRDLPGALADGIGTVATDDGDQRVMVRTLADGRRLAVAQPIAVRQDAVTETLMSTVTPILVGAPILILAAWLVVGWALRPVEKLRAELEARDDGDLAPLPAMRVPAELAGLLDALETHHRRASEVLQGQRRFAAEAAHELRTPVAAVSFQAEHLLASQTEAERLSRQAALGAGLERLRGLCEQLLILGDEGSAEDRVVTLEEVALVVGGGAQLLADEHGAEVSWDLGEAASVLVPEAGTRMVLQNLIANAIRYAGKSGPIEVRAWRGVDWVRLEVADSGPGLREPAKAVDAFHREAGQDVPGTGLGLAITARTVERLGGELELTNRAGEQSGLLARVLIPSGTAESVARVPAGAAAEGVSFGPTG